MRHIHEAHHTACRVLLEKKFPQVFCQVWSLLFSIMPSRCVTAGCSNTTKDGVSLHRFMSDPIYRRIAYKAMLLPDAIPTIFPLSIRRLWRLQPRREVLFKARKTQDKWPFSNTPMHNPVHYREKRHVHTMLTVSVFTAWKHAVISTLIKHRVWFLYPGKTNIKTLNLSHYVCACFEFFLNDQNFDSTLSVIS